MKAVNYYGYVTSNVGDALGPWLIKKMGNLPIYTPLDKVGVNKVIVSGSILPEAKQGCLVWGAGIATADAVVSPHAKLLAVRGPISRMRALQSGVQCPTVLGDPGLLAPRFYTPAPAPVPRRYRLGILPHFVDQDVFSSFEITDRKRSTQPVQTEVWPPEDVLLIDVLQPVEAVVDAICSCERILSSSLHGLILAVAYRVPARWARFSNRVCGDGTKFHDFYLSLGAEVHEAMNLIDGCLPIIDELCTMIGDRPTQVPVGMLQSLYDACPFRNGEA